MNLRTKILSNSSSNISKIIDLLKSNRLVALPTETVYGLAANAYNDYAVKCIYDVKRRPLTSPLIIHFKNKDCALDAIKIDNRAKKLANKFWPGPLTLVGKIRDKQISNIACSEMNTVAVRVPSNIIFNKILNFLDFPLAAPSANRYGKITPTSAKDVKDELNGRISVILDGGISEIGLESTVVDLSTSKSIILRTGGIENEKIKEIIRTTNENLVHSNANSPGLEKYHYQPSKPLRINVKRPKKDEAFLAFGKLPENFNGPTLSLSKKKCLIETSKNLYRMLRILDKRSSKSIAVQKIPAIGLGMAINDRLLKASFKEKI